MRNLSDGKTNGIVLFYAKDGELYPIGLTQKQMESIDIMIGAAVGNSKLTVLSDKPMGKVTFTTLIP